MSVMTRIANLFRRAKIQRDIDRELASHIALRTEDNLAAGMSPREARRDAQLRFGSTVTMREKTTEADIALYFESLWFDIRYACRQLRKNPGFTATAILMMALGMGASVAIFAFVDAALIKPLPYRDPTRLVSVYESIPTCIRCNVSRQNWEDWKHSGMPFTSLDVWGYARYTVHSSQGTESAPGARISDGFFRTLGVAPVLGRDFYAGEDKPGAPHTVLISYGAWQNRFGGSKDVLGKTVRLDDADYSIIGVLPQNFQFAPRGNVDFWEPLNDPTSCEKRRGCHSLFGLGRLSENSPASVAVESAAARMRTIAAQFEKQYPDSNKGFSAVVIPLSESIVGNIRPILLVLLAGAGLLLLIACVNIVSLLLVRTESRRQEIAVRGALGASGVRLIRQFATEGLVLVAIGSSLGLALAYETMHLLLKLIPAGRMAAMPFLLGLGFTPPVLVFAISVAILAAIFFAIAPALRLAKSQLRADLAEGSRGSAGKAWRRLGSRLVVVELATAVVLLVGASLLGKSLYLLLHVDLGLQPDHLTSVVVDIPSSYSTEAQVIALEHQIEQQALSIPGVKSAGISSHLPVRDWDGGTNIAVPGHPALGDRNDVPERDVSSAYFTTIGATLLRGRYFTEAEDDPTKPPIVIINEAAAIKFFPGEDPLGKLLAYAPSMHTIRIIGVVADIKEGQMDTANRPTIYRPFNQDSWNSFCLIVRGSQDAGALLPSLTAAVHQVNANITTSESTTLADVVHDSQSAYLHRSLAWLVGGFAALALILAVIGLYGVIAYSVSQRTREIGVRMALGAQRASVYRLIMKEAGWLTVTGLAAGLVCSIAAATFMRSLLFGTQAWDGATLAAVAAVLAVSALLASYIPARRAASVNPVEALRAE